jgi:hypothetical protein
MCQNEADLHCQIALGCESISPHLPCPLSHTPQIFLFFPSFAASTGAVTLIFSQPQLPHGLSTLTVFKGRFPLHWGMLLEAGSEHRTSSACSGLQVQFLVM